MKKRYPYRYVFFGVAAVLTGANTIAMCPVICRQGDRYSDSFWCATPLLISK